MNFGMIILSWNIYIDTDGFIIYIETDDFYKDIADDVEEWSDTSKYDKNDKRPLPIGKSKKVIGKFKDELDEKIMTEFVALRAKAYAYKKEDDSEHKKAKGIKKCVIKRKLKFKNYKYSLFKNEIVLTSEQIFKSDHQRVYTTEVNKTALNSNDDKRIPALNKVTTCPHETNAFKVCESEMLSKIKMINTNDKYWW